MKAPPFELARYAEIAGSCTNARLRKLSRLVGAIYDDALRRVGLRGGQLNVLVALAMMGEASTKRLAVTLGMDRTTLCRGLKPLERDGLVRDVPGADGRERVLALTKQGHARLKAAIPRWEAAQAQVAQRLGESMAQELADQLDAAVAKLRSTH
jgi:DNA-binding MarR family transcriptional regulator